MVRDPRPRSSGSRQKTRNLPWPRRAVVLLGMVAAMYATAQASSDPPDREQDARMEGRPRGVDPEEQREVEARQHEDRSEQRHQHQPDQDHVTQDGAEQGPRVGREQAGPRAQVVAELAQVRDRLRLRIELRARLERGQLARHLLHVVADAMDPGGEPAADVAAAGDGGEVVELGQEPGARQPLENAQGEGGAADAPARQAERGALLGQRMDRLVERGESVPVVRPRAPVPGSGPCRATNSSSRAWDRGRKAVDWRVVPPVAARSGPISSTLGRPPRGGQGI